MNVEQRPGTEGRQPEEANGDADRLGPCQRNEHESGRMIAQQRNQAFPNVRCQRRTAAHGIARVRIQDVDDAGRVPLVGEIGLAHPQVDVAVQNGCPVSSSSIVSSTRDRVRSDCHGSARPSRGGSAGSEPFVGPAGSDF
jgi:hypothetical protein